MNKEDPELSAENKKEAYNRYSLCIIDDNEDLQATYPLHSINVRIQGRERLREGILMERRAWVYTGNVILGPGHPDLVLCNLSPQAGIHL